MEIAVSTSPAHIMMTRKKNTWYSVCDGNWSNPNIWMSNALDKRRITTPRAGDDVYINHNVNLDVKASINNLYIEGKLTSVDFLTNVFTISGDLQCNGIIDFSGNNTIVLLYGTNNHINSFIPGNSNIIYTRAGDQAIMPLAYTNLTIRGTGTKRVVADLTITTQFEIDDGSSNILELGTYNANFPLTYIRGALSKTGSGIVNFYGLLNIGDAGNGTVSFTGNPTINMYNGFGGDARYGINFGTGTLNVLTTQTWSLGSPGQFWAIGSPYVLISSGATLTIPVNKGWLNNGTVTGVDSTSVLNINGTYAYGNTNSAMPIGVFNYNNSGTSAIQVQAGVTLTLPFTSYYDLTLYGTGILSSNSTISHNLTIQSGTLECSTFDLTCNGIIENENGILSKTGAGTVNLNTILTNNTMSIAFTGNPTVNLSGNITGDTRNGFNLGNGTINILQSLTLGIQGVPGFAGGLPNIAGNVLIASGKTLTNAGRGSLSGGLTLMGTITGADSTAIFDNRSQVNYQNSTAPMVTGKLYCNQAANTFIYGASGNQNIQVLSDATPGYSNLTLNGSGIKTLMGNVSVKGIYTLTSPATLNSNGFNLTNP